MVLIFTRPVHRRSGLFLLARLSIFLSVGLLSVPESAISQPVSQSIDQSVIQSAVRGRNWGAHAL